jgi:nitrate/nitrite transport system substrate-binding protein
MVKGAPDYQGVTRRVMRPDLYGDAMKELGVATKVAEVQKLTFFDGVTFDAAGDLDKQALSYPINSVAG